MEVNAKVLIIFLLGVTTLASGFVIRPYENIEYEVLDDIPGGDKSLDLEELEPDTIDEYLPETTSTSVTKVTTTSHTNSPTVVYDPDDNYDDNNCDCPPQFLIYIYDRIC